MSKPITGKNKIGERREKRQNGDVYVYERITAYNETTRKTYTVSQKLKCLGMQTPLIVTDNGYYSQKNMMEFAMSNVKFLTLVDPGVTWVRETVDELRETIAGMASTCPFDPTV